MKKMTRSELGQAIMDLMAGQETESSFQAQADALATGVGGTLFLSGWSKTQALDYIDELARGMKTHVRKNWGDIQSNVH